MTYLLILLSVCGSILAQSSDIAVEPRDGSQRIAKHTNGKIQAMTSVNGLLYFGGLFSTIDNDPTEIPFAVVDTNDGSLVNIGGTAEIDGSINAITSTANGDVYIGTSSGVAKISAGRWEQLPLGGVSGSVDYVQVKGDFLGLGGQFTIGRQPLVRVPPSIIQLSFGKSVLCDHSLEEPVLLGEELMMTATLLRPMSLRKIRFKTSGVRAISAGDGVQLSYVNGTLCVQCMISAAENIWTVFLISTAGELSALRLQLSGSSNGKLIRLQLFSYGLDFRTADSPNSEDACATEIEPNQAEISPIFGQWIANPNGLGLISEASVEPVELTLVFNLPTSGQYQIFFVFPACDNISCLAQRSLVAVEMSMVSSGNTFSTQIDQRSNGISSVLLYTGAVDGADRGFKPIITVRSLNSNNAVQATSVAMDVIRFVQQQSPVEQSQTFVLLDLNARDANSAYTIIPGTGKIQSFEVIGQTGLLILLAGGAPTVMFFNQSSGQPQFTPNGGLFGDVKSTVIKGNDEIYVGGQFSASADQTVQRLNNLAMLDLVSNKWRPVGNGTEGPVDRLRFDKLRNTIHLFGENVLEGFRHAVYNLDNQQIGPDSQSPQSFDIAFDLNNIYYIGSFPNYKPRKSSGWLTEWWVVLLITLAVFLVITGLIVVFRRYRRRQYDVKMEPTTEEIKHWSLQQPPVIATLPLPTTGSIYIDTLVESQQQQQHDTVLPTVILTGTYSDESSVASMEIRSPFAEPMQHFEQNASADDTMTEISTENCEKQSISPISRASNLSETLANVSIEIPDSFLADTTTSSQNRPRSNANFEPAGTSDRLSDEQSVVSFTKSPVIYRAISDWGEIEGDLRIEAGQIVCLIEQQSDPQWIYAELFDSEMKPTGKRGILPISVLEHDSDGSANHTIY